MGEHTPASNSVTSQPDNIGGTLQGLKKSETWYEDDGDIEIETSDGYLIKTHAYYLQAGSSVFRDMIRNATGSRIQLCDGDIETEAAVDLLLRTVTQGPNTKNLCSQVGHACLRLLDKYAFERTLDLVSARFQLQVPLDTYGLQLDLTWIFLAGVALRNLRICEHALSYLSCDDGYGDLLLYYDLQQAELMGLKTIVALAKAQHVVDTMDYLDRTAGAKAFVEYMWEYEESGGMW